MSLWTELEQAYGIRIAERNKVRDVYRLKGSRGELYCWKPYDIPRAEAEFIAAVFIHLRKSGYRFGPRLMQTHTGERLLKQGKRYWMLTDWVRGSNPDFSRSGEIHKALRTLAKFHRKAEGLPQAEVPEARIRYATAARAAAEYRKEIGSHRGLARFARLCDDAEELSGHPLIGQAAENEQKAGAFVHGDYNYPNVVLAPTRRLHLIDMENTSMNVRMADLAHILYRNFPWDGPGVLRGVAEYDRKRPLSQADRRLLHMLLHLPYPLVRAIRQYGQRYKSRIALPSSTRIRQYTNRLSELL